MAPWHRGGTMANLGLVWGWRVLSPRWRGLWDGDLPDELPLAYAEQNMEKVVILLTDGNNEWYDYPGIDLQVGRQRRREPLHRACPAPTPIPPARPTSRPPGRVPTIPPTGASAKAGSAPPTMVPRGHHQHAHARAVHGDEGTGDHHLHPDLRPLAEHGHQDLYTACATEPDMYMHAATASTLQQNFVTIADELSALRIAE